MPKFGGVKVLGWGQALPPKVIPNEHFEATLGLTDDWVRTRTGVVERHVGGTTVGLAVEAGDAALRAAGIERSRVGALILATTTPDQRSPASASQVQSELGLTCAAFDLNAACSGFVYGVALAGNLLATYDCVLIIGSETLSTITDPADRSTAALLGDGAGAVVVGRPSPDLDVAGGGDTPLWADLGSDGALAHLIQVDHGGYVQMRGQEVFKQAVRCCVGSIERLLTEAGTTIDEIDLFVPHQANIRIIRAVAERVGIPEDRCAIVIDSTGNTSAASIPLALAAAADTGRLHRGDRVLLAGFGAGMTWGSALLRW